MKVKELEPGRRFTAAEVFGGPHVYLGQFETPGTLDQVTCVFVAPGFMSKDPKVYVENSTPDTELPGNPLPDDQERRQQNVNRAYWLLRKAQK